jgi:ADP-ribosyl-[dinitrogen reductase] hydrolase
MATISPLECASGIAAAILGCAVGDALGVPVEFQSRARLQCDSVRDMRAYGTHSQPAGTWSDDTSLTLCLAESLTQAGICFDDQSSRFVRWLREGKWSPHGSVFDIGNTTRIAIERLERGVAPRSAGPADESQCGNGSLMRISPIGVYLAFAPVETRVEAAMDCSRLTHGHPRCLISCAMFAEIVAALVRREPLDEAMRLGFHCLRRLLRDRFPAEAVAFARLASEQLSRCSAEEISSTGYVIHTLEASLWCAMRAKAFSDGLLSAVNLGDDTDTTGAVTGTVLGLLFGRDGIPAQWLESLARREELLQLCETFRGACVRRWQADASGGVN